MKHCLNLTTEEAQRLASKDPELRVLLEAAIPEAFTDTPLHIDLFYSTSAPARQSNLRRPFVSPTGHPGKHYLKSLYLDPHWAWSIEPQDGYSLLVARRKR